MKFVARFLLLLVPIFLFSSCELGDDGTFEGGTFYIDVSVSPNPPVVGNNTFLITVTTTEGAPVNDATITVTVEMPIQGTVLAVDPPVSNLGSGQYRIGPVNFDQAGLWEITIVAERGQEDGVWVKEYTVTE